MLIDIDENDAVLLVREINRTLQNNINSARKVILKRLYSILEREVNSIKAERLKLVENK